MTVPRLQYVWFWPNGGPVDGLWGDASSAAEDVFARSSRRVTERYSEALANQGLNEHRSAIQMFIREADDESSGVRLEADLHRVGDEVFRAIIPGRVTQLSAQSRARLVLEVVDAAMQRLARERGWPLEAFRRARQHTMDHGLGFCRVGAWNSNPSRKRRVRPVVRIIDDGWGVFCFEVADVKSGDSLGFTRQSRSPLNSAPKFKRSTRELRWADDSTLERPSDWQVRIGGEWGEVDVYDIADLRPWPHTIEPLPESSPLPVELREM